MNKILQGENIIKFWPSISAAMSDYQFAFIFRMINRMKAEF